jgi:uncharacterized protein YjdB
MLSLSPYRTITADQPTFSIRKSTDLHAVFFDTDGEEIIVPDAASPHHITWSSDDPSTAIVAPVFTSASGEKAYATGINKGTVTIRIVLDDMEEAYDYQGNTEAYITLTVNN